jgi:hypothetical protein
MQAHQFDKLIIQIGHSQQDWDTFLGRADDELARYQASDLERQVFLSGDVQQLSRWGVNGYLLLRYARWHGKDIRALQQLEM